MSELSLVVTGMHWEDVKRDDTDYQKHYSFWHYHLWVEDTHTKTHRHTNTHTHRAGHATTVAFSRPESWAEELWTVFEALMKNVRWKGKAALLYFGETNNLTCHHQHSHSPWATDPLVCHLVADLEMTLSETFRDFQARSMVCDSTIPFL